MRSPAGIPATITIDPTALAALVPSSDASNALLNRIEKLLAEVKDRLDADARIAVDGKTAADLLGICDKTLRDSDCPRVHIGASARYRVEALREWAKAMEKRPRLKSA